jgi:hypothetical protein
MVHQGIGSVENSIFNLGDACKSYFISKEQIWRKIYVWTAEGAIERFSQRVHIWRLEKRNALFFFFQKEQKEVILVLWSLLWADERYKFRKVGPNGFLAWTSEILASFWILFCGLDP